MQAGRRILVTGAGGFIGYHLVERLKAQGHWVRGVDLHLPEFTPSAADEFRLLDLRQWEHAREVMEGVQDVYALAADMGGMGYISSHHAQILHNNLLISAHTIEAAREADVERYLYSSSACVYPEYLQEDTDVAPLMEDDAYPAQPQDAYGWEKLVTERLAEHYHQDYGMDVRVVRFHNIYGAYGTWDGGREKAPAALCRKVAFAKLTGSRQIEMWGDGEQTRSFCHIDDCVEGLQRIMESGYQQPLNLGRDEMVSINQLARIIARVAGVDVTVRHVDGPQGVRGRNSDNALCRDILGWEPGITLEEGIRRTYPWIEAQVRAAHVASTRVLAGGA